MHDHQVDAEKAVAAKTGKQRAGAGGRVEGRAVNACVHSGDIKPGDPARRKDMYVARPADAAVRAVRPDAVVVAGGDENPLGRLGKKTGEGFQRIVKNTVGFQKIPGYEKQVDPVLIGQGYDFFHRAEQLFSAQPGFFRGQRLKPAVDMQIGRMKDTRHGISS